MKKLTLLLSALMLTGLTYAQDGNKKACCKDKKENCDKTAKKDGCKKDDCCSKKADKKSEKTAKK